MRAGACARQLRSVRHDAFAFCFVQTVLVSPRYLSTVKPYRKEKKQNAPPRKAYSTPIDQPCTCLPQKATSSIRLNSIPPSEHRTSHAMHLYFEVFVCLRNHYSDDRTRLGSSLVVASLGTHEGKHQTTAAKTLPTPITRNREARSVRMRDVPRTAYVVPTGGAGSVFVYSRAVGVRVKRADSGSPVYPGSSLFGTRLSVRKVSEGNRWPSSRENKRGSMGRSLKGKFRFDRTLQALWLARIRHEHGT